MNKFLIALGECVLAAVLVVLPALCAISAYKHWHDVIQTILLILTIIDFRVIMGLIHKWCKNERGE